MHILLVQHSAVSCCYVICHRGPEPGSGPNLAPMWGSSPVLSSCHVPTHNIHGHLHQAWPRHHPMHTSRLMMEQRWTRKMFEQLPNGWRRSLQIFWEQHEMKPPVAWPIILIPAIWQFWYPNITCIHCDHASVAAERRFKTRVAPSLFCYAVRINTRNFRLKRNYSQFLGKMNKHFWILHWYTPEKFSRKSYLPVKISYKLWSHSIIFHITIILKLYFRRMNQVIGKSRNYPHWAEL